MRMALEGAARLAALAALTGAAACALIIGVDEGNHLPPGVVPAGYDGVIERMSDGRYDILWDNGGGACCFASVDEAKAAYPQYHLFVR